MLSYNNGIIGLPLRLLAREVYDRMVILKDRSSVALVTGEERIIPLKPKYWVCTTESMPTNISFEFVAIDEIQLCADLERGHVFTDRMLTMRGQFETLFLGSKSIWNIIVKLFPNIEIKGRERFSTLSCSGSRKISRMAPRSAIIGFSVDNVYGMAELVRRQKGGAAVVLGALSPRTRNKQVALYQNGDVDFLVATDAIGMGLNLDIDHVAFSSQHKFDGTKMRMLFSSEIAQIAGRAGRYMRSGTFGTTGESKPFDEKVVEEVENNKFDPIKRIMWRNSNLDMGTGKKLIESLEMSIKNPILTRGPEALDLAALKLITSTDDYCLNINDPNLVKLLWQVCKIPDFRSISLNDHVEILSTVFHYLKGGSMIPDDWLHSQLDKIDRYDGEIDTISKRLAFVRTWTYVTQRDEWVNDPSYWQAESRRIEDGLSDALHDALTKRFVDRRTSVLIRRLKQKEKLVAEVNQDGEVTIDGQFIGKLHGFRFIQDKGGSVAEDKTIRTASIAALEAEFHLRSSRFYNAPDTEIDFTDQGGLMWGEHAVGKLLVGENTLSPRVIAFVDDEAGNDVRDKVERRLNHFVERKIESLFEPLYLMKKDENIVGLSKGLAFRLIESMGIIPRQEIINELKDMDQDSRALLRKHGVRFGQFNIFLPLLLKPAVTRMRLVLWALKKGFTEFPSAPVAGLVTINANNNEADGYFVKAGYHYAGEWALRIDMLERLADLIRKENTHLGFEANSDMLSITGMTNEQFSNLMSGLGYDVTLGERQKVVGITSDPNPENANKVYDNSDNSIAKETIEPEMQTFWTFVWKNKKSKTKKDMKLTVTKSLTDRKREKQKRSNNSSKNKKQLKFDTPPDPNNPFSVLLALKGK
tara:strand:+ start:2206 stop:4812 length:2607 start_codon:yes stop_codon:yes gene_type:complete